MEEFRVLDPLGRSVAVTSDRLAHIRVGHPPLGDHADLIENTVRDPETIREDTSHYVKGKREYYRSVRHVEGLKPRRYVVTVVVDHASRPGVVVTAWPSSDLNDLNKGGRLIYARS